jgi:hypothetical protein
MGNIVPEAAGFLGTSRSVILRIKVEYDVLFSLKAGKFNDASIGRF